MFQITKFTLIDRIYPIEYTYIRIEDILWPRQILRVVKVRAISWGKQPCSFLTYSSFVFQIWRVGWLVFHKQNDTVFIFAANLMHKPEWFWPILFKCIAFLKKNEVRRYVKALHPAIDTKIALISIPYTLFQNVCS